MKFNNNYHKKYIKYKNKYFLSKQIQVGGTHLVIHIAGSQGSGKTTLGHRLIEKYGDMIVVLDLDDLAMNYDTNVSYQQYLDNIVEINKSKHLIFVGLDAELCLGTMEDSDITYNLHSEYNFYIKSSHNTLKQRFFRQIDKLENRKEWFFNEWLTNPEKTQEKLFRFVNINQWNENNEKCDNLYKQRGYEFMDSNQIFDKISSIIELHH